jgi:hypothetical protein
MRNTTYEVLPLAQRFFDIANVEFVVTSQQLSGATPAGPWQIHTQDGNIRVYRNPAVLPRAYIVPEVRVVDADTAIGAVYDVTFDPTRQAIVEQPIGELAQPASFQDQMVANITSYEAERVVIETTTQTTGLLVLSDSYAPGWRVTIDDTPTRLYRANAVYRGVVVHPGTHRIEMTYRPFFVELGFTIAGITTLLCGLGAFWNRRRRLQSTTVSSST